MRESLKKAQANYQKKCKIINIRLNKETDADIIDILDKTDNVQGLIKDLIRKYGAK